MDFIPQAYAFTTTDAQALKAIGYEFTPDNIRSLESFMQTRFPDFNLLSLLRVVEKQFSDTTSKRIIKTIEFDKSTNTLRVDYRNEFINEDDALVFVREFSVTGRGIRVNHIFCIIPKGSRNIGLIKPVFQESLQQYVNSNVKTISVHAGLSGGGYTWARHGFCAIKRSEVDLILQGAKQLLKNHEFGVVEKIYNTYYNRNPKGKAFPIDLWAALDYMKPVLMGSDWHGELNLKNKEQFRNFKDYVSR